MQLLSSLDESLQRVGGIFFQPATHTQMPEGRLPSGGSFHKGRGRAAPDLPGSAGNPWLLWDCPVRYLQPLRVLILG